MRLVVMLTFLILLVFSDGCCTPNERTEPQHPGQVSGWKDTYERDAHILSLGRFILKEGESTNNGHVKVELIDIIPPDKCVSDAGSLSSSARAVLRFVRLEDSKVLLEDRFSDGSNTITNGTLEIAAVGIYNINVKEAWVYFGLLGFYDR